MVHTGRTTVVYTDTLSSTRHMLRRKNYTLRADFVGTPFPRCFACSKGRSALGFGSCLPSAEASHLGAGTFPICNHPRIVPRACSKATSLYFTGTALAPNYASSLSSFPSTSLKLFLPKIQTRLHRSRRKASTVGLFSTTRILLRSGIMLPRTNSHGSAGSPVA